MNVPQLAELVPLLLVVGAALWLASRAWVRRSRELASGSRDTAQRTALARYSRRTGAARWTGALVGGVLHGALTTDRVPPPPFDGIVVPILLGYLLGVLVGELFLGTAPRGAVREASLTPRRVHDYISPMRLWVLRAAAAASLLAAALRVSVPEQQFLPQSWSDGQTLAIAALLAVAVAWFVEIAVLRVARRRPKADADSDPVDEALRVLAVHRLVSAGSAIALFVLAGALWTVAGVSSAQAVRWVAGGVSLVSATLAIANMLALAAPAGSALRVRSPAPTYR